MMLNKETGQESDNMRVHWMLAALVVMLSISPFASQTGKFN